MCSLLSSLYLSLFLIRKTPYLYKREVLWVIFQTGNDQNNKREKGRKGDRVRRTVQVKITSLPVTRASLTLSILLLCAVTMILPHLLLYQGSGPRLRDPHMAGAAAVGPSDQHGRLGAGLEGSGKIQDGDMTKFSP